MTAEKTPPAEHEDAGHESRLHRIEETVREHLRAAEVAMEEAAPYGSGTAAVKGAEAAVAPETELGSDEDDAPSV